VGWVRVVVVVVGIDVEVEDDNSAVAEIESSAACGVPGALVAEEERPCRDIDDSPSGELEMAEVELEMVGEVGMVSSSRGTAWLTKMGGRSVGVWWGWSGSAPKSSARKIKKHRLGRTIGG